MKKDNGKRIEKKEWNEWKKKFDWQIFHSTLLENVNGKIKKEQIKMKKRSG